MCLGKKEMDIGCCYVIPRNISSKSDPGKNNCMNYQISLWVLFGVLLITYSFVRKKQNKKLNAGLWILMILILIGQVYLPRQLFGKWNSISNLNDKKIIEIILRPSAPNWKVNLVGKDFLILDKNHIDTLIQLLQKTEAFSQHTPR